MSSSPRPFRFQNMWLRHHDFMATVKASWERPISADPLNKLVLKLRSLKHVLKSWNSNVFGNLFTNIKNAEDKVLQCEQAYSDDSSNEVLQQLEDSKKLLAELHLQEEIFFFFNQDRPAKGRQVECTPLQRRRMKPLPLPPKEALIFIILFNEQKNPVHPHQGKPPPKPKKGRTRPCYNKRKTEKPKPTKGESTQQQLLAKRRQPCSIHSESPLSLKRKIPKSGENPVTRRHACR